MADQYKYLNENSCTADRKNNKVYINPNYNRPESSMHLNPNFSHITPAQYNKLKEQKHQISKARIYVNPNFIRKTNIYDPIVNKEPIVVKPLTKHVDISTHHLTSGEQQLVTNNQTQAPPSLHITKSKYCFVRQKENVVMNHSITRSVNTTVVTNPAITRSANTTVKINKYKSVSMNVVKRNLAIVKHPKSPTQPTFTHNVRPKQMTSCHLLNTSFKYFKSNNATVLNQSQPKYAARRPSLLKSVVQKKNKALMKKNNIPCPLFKKYGLCLRKIRGNCEYSHDKKHISICRKFLKGICHDDNCLLSHDLTDKKMPTCYFYLQGACNKESCPYLHVKLNEKTKICQDFLRGYCENGEKCLFRHINASYTSSKRASSSSAIVKLKSKKKSLAMLNQNQRNNGNKQAEGAPAKELRYFKEPVEENILGETCDVIKPSRIKLGTLPSFIQL